MRSLPFAGRSWTMGRTLTKFRFRINAITFFWLALLLLVLPLRWVAAAGLAALFHELCHMIAVRACGGRVNVVAVGESGAVMETADLTNWQELLCAMAGPLGGLLLLFFLRWFPEVAVCAAFQSAFNLLPIYPLDGGRCLRCVVSMVRPTGADTVCVWVAGGSCLLLFALGIWAAAVNLGLIPLMTAGIVAMKSIRGKIPCKHRLSAVQ